IPFGPRKITGFVMEITNTSTFKQLKSVIDILDVEAVLTDELLQLGKWLAHETASLYISTYQAMLPQVLKSTYEKEVVKAENVILPEPFSRLFADKDRLHFDVLVGHLDELNTF